VRGGERAVMVDLTRRDPEERPARTPPSHLLALALLACAPARLPEGPLLFVSEAGSGTVAAVDPSSGRVVKRLRVGLLPHEMVPSPDGEALYVVLVGSQAVAEVDLATLSVTRTFLTAPVPAHRDDGSVILPHRDKDAFSHTTCFDCHFPGPGGARPPYVGDRPFGIALSEDGKSLFVAHVNSGDLAEIERATGRITRRVHLAAAGEASEATALARVGQDLFVALRPRQPSSRPGVIRRLDAATLEPRGDTPAGSDPVTLLAREETREVLVSNFDSDTVSLVGASGERARFKAAPGPLGLVALPDRRQVLALDYYSNALSLIDLAQGTVTTRPLERAGRPYANPTEAAVMPDGRTAFVVTSGTEGHLVRVDLRRLRVLGDTPLNGLSFGIALAAAKPPRLASAGPLP